MKFTLDEGVVVTRIFMVILFQLVVKITFGVSYVTLERYEICEFVFMDVSKTCRVGELCTANNRGSVIARVHNKL